MAYKNPEDRKAYAKRHYEANKEAYVARAVAHTRNSRRETARFLQGLKDRPCTDCGVKYPYYVMQFDHCKGDKSFNVSRPDRYVSREKLEIEILKCEVVCANCHAKRTFSRTSNTRKNLP